MSKELKVGTFVIASLLICVATFVYVANIQLRGASVPYKVYFNYAGGIEPGAPVRFGGMKAGTITAVRPWHKDPTKIEVLLQLKQDVPVNSDSSATLTSLSPLGDKYLEISTGSDNAPRLAPGATIPSAHPTSWDDVAKQASTIIPAVRSTLDDVQKNFDQLTGDARLALANIQTITGPQNQRNLALLLTNARELLDQESPRVDAVLRNLDQASSQASAVLNDVGTAARAANDTVANANRTIDELRDPIKADLADLQRTMTEARGLITDLNTVVLTNRDNIDDTLENFRTASENLRDLTASVRQRPWILLRGKPAADRAVPVARSGR